MGELGGLPEAIQMALARLPAGLARIPIRTSAKAASLTIRICDALLIFIAVVLPLAPASSSLALGYGLLYVSFVAIPVAWIFLIVRLGSGRGELIFGDKAIGVEGVRVRYDDGETGASLEQDHGEMGVVIWSASSTLRVCPTQRRGPLDAEAILSFAQNALA